MRVLVVSDIHSNLAALDAVLDDAGKWDAAICAGDVVGYGPNPQECVERIYFKGFRCASGNHDRAVATVETDWFNENAQEAIRINRGQLSPTALKWLGELPTGLQLDLDEVKISVYHGSPTQPLTSYIFPGDAEAHADRFLSITGADALILGHTHVPYAVRRGNRLMLNPGSVGQPRDGDPRASYLILETSPLSVVHRRVEYSVDATAAAIDTLGIPHRFANRLYRGL